MLDKDQLGIVRGSVAALAVVVAAIGGGYIWVSPQWFGLTNGMAMSDQIAFALKADPPLFLWSALCVPVVSKKRAQLVLIPLLVAVHLVGRLAFWTGYPHGAARRSFGMALSAAPTFASAAGLMAAGR